MHPNGWRVSLGLAACPAFILFLGSLIIPESPTSLVERKSQEDGKKALIKIRGVEDVDGEFQEIVHACEVARQVKHPFKKLKKKSSMPPLLISVCIQVFQQFTGINAIMFYAPVLFQTLGYESDASLLSSVITGLVNVISTFVSIALVDRVGRRILLLQACCQMLISQVHEICETKVMRFLKKIIVKSLSLFVHNFAASNWGDLGDTIENNGITRQGICSGSGGSCVHIRDVICMVMGTFGMVNSK